MHTTFRLLPVLAAGFLFVSSAVAQTGAIAGTVKGDDGKPLKDAIVKIERLDIKGNYKTKSNKKGEFIHAGLPLGQYRVSVEVNGQVRDQVNGVRTTLGDPVEVNFDLEAQKKKQDALQAAAQTGQLTKEQARDMSPEQKEAMEKALKEREKALAKNKELNDAFGSGMEAMKTGNFDTAVQQFEKATTLDPKQHVVWGQLAESYSGQAKSKTGAEQQAILEKSYEAYRKALELKPDDAGYHNNFALALARGKKFDEAQAELTKAAQIDPVNAGKYYFNLGALLVNNGQIEPAGQAFKKAIEADPNHADSHYQYGIYLMSKAQTDANGKVTPAEGTKEAFQKYLELKPDGPNAESARGMLAMMDSQISTEYQNPDSKKKAPASSKKKK